jgi:hypothetical protein
MLAHWPMTPADAYLWTLPMFPRQWLDVHVTVTAAGRQAHLPAEVRRTDSFQGRVAGTGDTAVRGADRVDHARERAGRR